MRMLLAAALLATSACATSPREATGDSVILAQAVTAIEQRSGGRLGVAVTDARGALLFGHRAEQPFGTGRIGHEVGARERQGRAQ